MAIYTILSAIPILFSLITMSVFKWGSIRSIGISFIITFVLAFFVWHINITDLISYMILGVFDAFYIVLIIFGAIFLLNILTKSKAITIINNTFTNVSKDARVQLMLIGLVFNTFLCGIAAFGTEVALTAVVLIALRFPPLAAAVAALAFNGPLVTFGAVGVPTVTTIQQTLPWAIKAGFNPIKWANDISTYSAFIHIFVGISFTLMVLFIIIKIFGKEKSWKPFFEFIPFALFSTLSVLLPYYLTAKYIGPDLPAVIGGIAGFVLVIAAAKLKFLVPKSIWHFPPKETWNKDWLSSEPEVSTTSKENDTRKAPSILMSWLPYIVCSIILILTRIPELGIQPYFKQPTLDIHNLFGLEKVHWKFPWLYTPGIMPFIIVSILSIFVYKINWKETKGILSYTFTKSKVAILALILSIMMVKIMANSGDNNINLPGMLALIASVLSNLKGIGVFLMSPILGILGTFVSGSNTTSDILFSTVQFNVALLTDLPAALLVVMQNTSGGVGDIFALKSIIIVASVTGLAKQEGTLLRYGLAIAGIGTLVLLTVSFCMLHTIW